MKRRFGMKMKGSGEKGVGEIMEELFKKHLFKWANLIISNYEN